MRCPPLFPCRDADGRFRLALLLAIEYAWNVFPSTNLSSGVLLVSHDGEVPLRERGFAHGADGWTEVAHAFRVETPARSAAR